jgi:hypothetical protein
MGSNWARMVFFERNGFFYDRRLGTAQMFRRNDSGAKHLGRMRAARQILFQTLIRLALGFIVTAGTTVLWAGTTLEWKGTRGNWEDAASWGGTLPSRTTEARINGTQDKPSQVILAHTNVLVSHVSVADAGNSLASMILDGPSLTVTASMDVGKYNGSDGRFVLKSGNLFAGNIFVAGGGGPDQRGRGTIEIQGGSVITKDLMLGNSSGGHSTLRIVGSKAAAIAVEDYLAIGVYNYLELEKEPPPSASELIFDIDAEGVTPIFTWGKTEGRVTFPVPDNKGNGVGTCKLVLHLLAAPPSGDILLIGAPNKCKGEFTELPEGAAVRAEFENKTYEWKLTYRGGTKRCDIMLTHPHIADVSGKMTPYATARKAKAFQFDRAVVESAYREFYRQVDAQQVPIGGGPLAFPGAEGYGAYAKGGRGGKVLFVTNLSDSGAGSLREAIETKGPRTVIFRVGGLIETKGLVVREPYLTIAGQTAPGDGICIKKTESSGDAFALSATHDVIIRFLRIRAGNNSGEFRSESFRASDSDDFIVDHCSCSWGTPQTLTTSGSLDRFTVQWCIIGEGSNRQRHAFATGVGGDRSTWHHNLFAHMQSRVPRWGDITVQCDFRNNVIYDWGHCAGYGDLRTINYVNNYLRPGPSTTMRPPYFIFDPKVILSSSIYVDGNIMVGMADVGRDNWKGVRAQRSLQSSTPFPAPQVQTQSAAEAFELVLRNAGATRPRRDSVDARIVSNVRNGTGRIINDEKEVGGWPDYKSGEPPLYSANDGIPDEWKKARGLSLTDPNVANTVNAEGYTQLEMYLNSLVTP